MSSRRLSGASSRGLFLLFLWLSFSTVQAAVGPSAHPTTAAGELRAELSRDSVQVLRRDVSNLRRELRQYRHARHRRAHRPSAEDLLRRPAGRTLADDVHAHPPEGDEAVQSGFSIPWREDQRLAGPPASPRLIARAGSPHLTGVDYARRHSPRGPPLPL